MKNLVLIILGILLTTMIVGFALGQFNFAFAVGFVFALTVLAVGNFYGIKNYKYSYKGYIPKGFLERNRD